MTHSRRVALSLLLVVLILAACAPGANPLTDQALSDGGSPAGFLLGVWHGFIVVITFIISLFSDSVGVYEVHNTGWSYNLGYLFGLMMALGGSGAGARRKR